MGNKVRLNYKQQKEEETRKQSEEKRRKKIKYVIIPSVLGGIVLITAAFIFTFMYIQNNGIILRNTVAMSSEHFKVDNAMMTYYVHDTYKSYLENFADSLTSDGLDTETDLDKQQRNDEQTWREFFIEKAEGTVKDILVMAEAAKADGYELSSDQKAELEKYLSEIDLSDYPKGIKLEDIRNAEELYRLAVSYDDKLYSSLTYSDSDIAKYYDENEYKFQYYSYRYYTFSYSLDSDDSDLTLSKDEAKDYASKLAKAKNEDEFTNILSDYFKETSPDISEKQLNNEMDSTLVPDAQYITGDPFSKWVFEEGRKAGDIYKEDSEQNQTYAVYFLLSVPHRKDESTVNIRHILFSSGGGDSDYDALDKAAQTQVQWEESGKSEEEFIKLAKELSDDKASAENGGLYENLMNGETVDEFNDWCFDEGRKNGDYEIVKTDYGYHLMYYIGKGLPTWQIEVKNAMLESDYKSAYENYREKCTLTVSENYTKQIPFN